MDDFIFNILMEYNALSFHQLGSPAYRDKLSDGSITFNDLNFTSGIIDYSFNVNDSPFTKYHRKNDLTRMSFKIAGVGDSLFGNKALIIKKGQLSVMDVLNEAFILYRRSLVAVDDGITQQQPDTNSKIDTWQPPDNPLTNKPLLTGHNNHTNPALLFQYEKQPTVNSILNVNFAQDTVCRTKRGPIYS